MMTNMLLTAISDFVLFGVAATGLVFFGALSYFSIGEIFKR